MFKLVKALILGWVMGDGLIVYAPGLYATHQGFGFSPGTITPASGAYCTSEQLAAGSLSEWVISEGIGALECCAMSAEQDSKRAANASGKAIVNFIV